MKNKNSYWKKRVEAEMEARLASGDTISKQMKSLHDYYFGNIQKEIESFYQRYADKNGLTKADAKKRVSEFDVEAFSDKAARYVREKDFSARANSELALYNLKMKVSRLEMLQYHLDLEMVALADEEKKLTERFLKDGYMEEVRFQAGILADTVASPKHLRDISGAIINVPFKGATWSENIWKRQDALREILQEEIRGAILKGRNPVELIPQLRKEFEVSYQHARRLAITEYARVQSEVQKANMKNNGFEKYVYLAESGACKICAPLDNKVFLVDEMQPGENCAPMHPHCRCSTAPVFEKDEKRVKPKYEHMEDVTHEWLTGHDHLPQLNILNEYTKDGQTYIVDGRHVVLDHSNYEYQVANWLSTKTGRCVDIVPRVNYPQGIHTPDYLVDGVQFDLKEIEGVGKTVIDNNSKKAKKQAPNIIFDITKTPLSQEEIKEQIHDVYRQGRRGLQTSILKKGDELIAALIPKQKR